MRVVLVVRTSDDLISIFLWGKKRANFQLATWNRELFCLVAYVCNVMGYVLIC